MREFTERFSLFPFPEAPPKRQPTATKSPQTGTAKKQQKSPSPAKPRKTTAGRGRGKAASPIKPSKGGDDTPMQAGEKEQDSDAEDLEEVTALTLTKPGGRKRKSPAPKRQNAAAQKPRSKRAKVMDQEDSPNLKTASSQETDERSTEEEPKGKTVASRKVPAPPSGVVSTRRRGGRKRKVQEREEKDEEEEEVEGEGEKEGQKMETMEENLVRVCLYILCFCMVLERE